MELIYQPTTSLRLDDYLKRNLNKDWEEFRAAIAFVKRSGTQHIINELKKLAKSAKIELLIGIDHQGTSADSLAILWRPSSRMGE